MKGSTDLGALALARLWNSAADENRSLVLEELVAVSTDEPLRGLALLSRLQRILHPGQQRLLSDLLITSFATRRGAPGWRPLTDHRGDVVGMAGPSLEQLHDSFEGRR